MAATDATDLADDASQTDDGGAAVSDDGAAASDDGGATCNDLVHGLKALFVQPPVACTNSAQCPSGDCCYVGPSGSSSCVMQ